MLLINFKTKYFKSLLLILKQNILKQNILKVCC